MMLLAGLSAGAVISAGDVWLYGSLIKAPMAVVMRRLPPMSAAWERAEVPWFIGLDFLAGIFLMWLYVALITRYGTSMRTALIAGFTGWFFFGLLGNLVQLPNGVMPTGLTVMIIGFILVEYAVAAVVGARVMAYAIHDH